MSKSVEKVSTQSKDIFAQELAKFSQIFPQFVSEGKVNFDALKKFLEDKNSLADEKDKYTFSWAGKDESFKAISRPSHATLNPKPDESVDFNNTENLFIEGDNLEVLKLLQTHYHGKIKMIYIDPPYNTGNDFIYKDNFKEGKSDYFERIGTTKDGIKLETNSDAHGRYHSQWLSMMYPRLFLAKQLLTDDGVIFISIDDHEQHHLKMLMNQIFGEDGFVAQITWQRTYAPISLKKYFSENHDFLFVYAKDKNSLNINLLPRTHKQNKDYKNVDNDPRGAWKGGNLAVGPAIEKQVYEIITPSGRKVMPPKGYCWRYNKVRFEEMKKDNRIWFGKDGGNVPAPKIFLSEVKNGVVPMTVWTYDEVGHNQESTREVRDIFEENVFTNPKPIRYLNRILHLGSNKKDIVLDFFAGSATTGHAVMDSNKEDNGDRKFILVQIPEIVDEKSEAFKVGYKTISDISKDRLRKAIEKNDYKDGFKVFSLAPTNYNIAKDYDGDDEQELLQQEISFTEQPLIDNFEPINLVYEIILKQGFSLNSKIKQQDDFYIVKDTELERKLVITLANTVDTNTIEALKLATDDILVCLDTALTDTQKVNFSRNFNLKVI